MKPLSRIAFAIFGLALAACYGDAPSHPLTPQELHPLKVSRTAMTLALDVPVNATALSADDAARFDRFVDDYLSIGSGGGLEVIVGEREGPASPRVAMLSARAVKRGVSAKEIKLRLASLGAGQPQPVVMSFRRYLVELPPCRQWNDTPSFNPGNTTGANFGCSIQRNIGNMVANPGDLEAQRPLGSVSATRTDRALSQYKQGKASESEKSDSNKATISTVTGGSN
jgi:pilus biogenesis lipoprotein CpaD